MAGVNEPPALIYLIRHARAGDPERWQGDDHQRPLTKRGRRQAEALGESLRQAPIQRILSSPYQRCVETVAPLARGLGLTVETSPTLATGADVAAVLALVTAVPTGTVLCSHGDVIPALLEALAAQGLLRPSAIRYERASAWVLERVAGRLVGARYLPAPEA